MQIDMHYYGTYCLARAAGIGRRDCQVIASAAQFVDDNAHGDAVELQCGTKIRVEATAHHPLDWRNLGVPTEREHQEGIWIPFHFLPENEGEEYEERLLCRQNSKLARKMVDHHLEWKNRKAYRMLVGIAAHVYADTFAHYGFSGIPSDWNEVKLKSLEVENKEVLGESLLDYVTGKLGKLVKEAGDRVKAQVAETASWGLGHGGAATYPDRPYMVWSFEYENTAHGERRGRKARDNPRTFLAGAKALHAMFQRVRETGKVASDGEGKKWMEIRAIVKRVIETPGEEDTRIKTWRKAARAGGLFEHGGEAIPRYEGREWNKRKGSSRERVTYARVVNEPWFQFYQAAATHRTYVLRDLLPSAGLAVS